MSEMPNENRPHDYHASQDNSAHRDRTERRSKPSDVLRGKFQIPSEEQCLAALGQLPALLLNGMLNTSQANVARGVYGTLLQHYRQPKTPKAIPVIEQKSLIDAVRQQPSLINAVAPFLLPEQLDEILKEIQGDESEAA